MPIELIIGVGIGFGLIIIVSALRFFMRPKEVEMSSYSSPAPAVLESPTMSVAPASYGDFSLTIDDVFSIKGRGTVATGKVTSGVLRVGQRVHVSAADGSENYETTVTGLEVFKKVIDTAQTGDYVGILLAGLSKEQVKKGMEIKLLN